MRKMIEGNLTDEEKALVEALGGWDKLMETLQQRLEEQRGRHQGGSKWIGTAGTSPFGAYGYNPEGIRIGQEGGRSRSAIKVWDERTFRNLDDSVEINTRNIKIALRRLRRFAREGVPDELDLDATIEGTAQQRRLARSAPACPSGATASRCCCSSTSAARWIRTFRSARSSFRRRRSEFRHLEYFYFHNCVYDHVWRDNRRRRNERIATFDLLHKYGPRLEADLRRRRGDEPLRAGAARRQRRIHERRARRGVAQAADRRVPPRDLAQPRARAHLATTRARRRWCWSILGPRMFPLTLDGLQRGIAALRK